MKEERAEGFIMAIEADIARFLNDQGKLSSSRIAGLLYLNNNDAAAIKVNVEESLKAMAVDPEYGGSPEHPLSFPQLAENRKKVLEQFRNGIGEKADSKTS